MMAMPIFISHYIIYVVLIVGSQTKGAKLAFAFVLNRSFLICLPFLSTTLTTMALLTLRLRIPGIKCIKTWIQIWKQNFWVSS